MKTGALFNWSGGKDSTLALYQVLKDNTYKVEGLLTTLNKKFNRISMHGVRSVLLDQQAKSLGFPLQKVLLPEMADMETYSSIMSNVTKEMKKKGITVFLFGDLFLEDIREYREKQLQDTGITAGFPIWHYPTQQAAADFIKLGFKAVLTSVDASKLDRSFAGREFDTSLLSDLPNYVDPCGENGEFHTFVYDGPIFSFPIKFKKGETIHKKYNLEDETLSSGFYFTDLIPE